MAGSRRSARFAPASGATRAASSWDAGLAISGLRGGRPGGRCNGREPATGDSRCSVAAASAEQTRGIEQVNQAITQMDQVTQQNAALVEEA